MDMKSLTARTNNRTKILNDMNKNDSSLAIADINKYSDYFEATSLGIYVYACTKIGHDEV